MGRNSDKRQKRRGGDGPSAEGAPAVAEQPAAAGLPRDSQPVPPAPARSLAGRLEIPNLVVDGSLARALFHITCLLSVRDARGVVRENLTRTAAEVASIVGADTVSLMRLEKGDDLVPPRLGLIGAHGLIAHDEGIVAFDLGDGIAGAVAQSGLPLAIEDAPRDARFTRLYGQRTEIGSLLAVPLRYGGRVIGVVTASRREVRAFSAGDLERLQVVADAIAQDLEQSRQLFDATVDPLTGLGSRLALLVALPREVEIARRYRHELSLILLDIDGLAELNAAGGRSAGDRILVESARRLQTSLRAADLAARLSGGQLAALLPMTPANNARALAKRLGRALSAPVSGAPESRLSWSVGVATLAPADEDAIGFLWRCDDAVNEAKVQGGDRIAAAAVPRRGPSDDA